MAFHKVAVVAFSFRDSQVKSLADWELLYGRENGKFYGGIVGGLAAYGIAEENITFIHYFADTKESAKNKIQCADIVYFLGGLPDKMMDRIKECPDPEATLANFNAWATYHPPVDIDWQHTGFFSITRSDFVNDTREEVLSALAEHFKL